MESNTGLPITIAIPVGPRPSHQRWLGEALESIRNQTQAPNEVLLIDDMAGLSKEAAIVATFYDAPYAKIGFRDGMTVAFATDYQGRTPYYLRFWPTPWRLGVPAAFNMGVAKAHNPLVVMMGSDDTLEPMAIEALWETYQDHGQRDGYYWYGVRYMDTGEVQQVPCNCAAVTKGLWRKTGGFAPEMAVGACDSMLISILMVHYPEMLIPVAGAQPLFNYRRHEDTDTAGRAPYQGPIFTIRDHLTESFKPPEWGRYE